MYGIAATSWSPERVDLFYLQPDFAMNHVACNPTVSTVDPSALKAVESDLTKGLTSITVATSVVPVVGTIVALLAEWLLSELPGAVVPGKCDGMVALEQDVLFGRDIALATAGGEVHTVTTEHPGTTSVSGCGATSKYQVQWSIRRV